VSSCLKHLAPQLDQPALAAAVLPAVLSPGSGSDRKQEARAYDVVMLLRHMCQLTPDPPPGACAGLDELRIVVWRAHAASSSCACKGA
jgi:hypothetical protein